MFPASRLESLGLQLQLYFLDAASGGSGIFVQLGDNAALNDGLLTAASVAVCSRAVAEAAPVAGGINTVTSCF